MIGHARSDERGKYSGGKAGDNNGNEVSITPWYSRPWNVVMWAKDKSIREKMASAMETACKNDNIGYDQMTGGDAGRYSLYEQLRKVSFDMAKVKVPVETDCSNLVACCANCAGVEISPYIYTGNEKSAFDKTGLFEIHTESKYLTSDKYIPRGAILLYEGHHTAINLNDGSEWKENVSLPAEGKLQITASSLNIRELPSTSGKIVGNYRKGATVKITEESGDWVKTDKGWISKKYVIGWIKEDGKWWYCENGAYPMYCLKEINGKDYAFDRDGWLITPDRFDADLAITK